MSYSDPTVKIKEKEIEYLFYIAEKAKALSKIEKPQEEQKRINEVYSNTPLTPPSKYSSLNFHDLAIDLEALNYVKKHEGDPRKQQEKFRSEVSDLKLEASVVMDSSSSSIIQKVYKEMKPF